MKKNISLHLVVVFLALVPSLYAQQDSNLPVAPLDLYLLIGQSNMAGRGKVEQQDCTPHARVLTLNKENDWVPAIDPIHFDKSVAGVGPGRTFGLIMADHRPLARIGLIPCAVGGTSIRKWQPGVWDEVTQTHPYDDMLKRLRLARQSGVVKGILWHQGESDSQMGTNGTYAAALTTLFDRLRTECNDPNLPIVIGQLGQFSKRPWTEGRIKVDQAHQDVVTRIKHAAFAPSQGLTDRGDLVHFDASSARLLGKRFAEEMIKLQGSNQAMVSTPKSARPNILFIITDQQFAEAMSCVGSAWMKTPAMDSLAEQGLRFTQAYVNYPVCMPERYSMFTGRLPCTRRQADIHNKPLVSLGNQAKKGGYDTAFFGKWHIQDQTFGRNDVTQHGFDINTGGKDVSMTDDAIQFLSQPKRKPFFAVVSYYNPHDICEWARKKAGRDEGITMYNGDIDTNPPLESCPPLPENFRINNDEAEAVRVRRSLVSTGIPNAQAMAMDFSGDDWRQYRWAYYRLVELVDKQIGRVLGALQENGLADNTVVIFTSDHGDGCGAHRWHQKSILYEESCRVPFIIRWPGKARQNERDDRLVSVGIDIMPTVSELVGVDMPKGPYYGKSVLPFVLDRNSHAPQHAYVVCEAEVRVNAKNTYQGRSLRTSRFKYHVWSKGEPREQLFDMADDPGETQNLVNNRTYAVELQKHRDLFADWQQRTDDTYEEDLK